MPTANLDPTLTMYYEDDCFADPWSKPEAVLMVHGFAESSRSWFAWVPHLARDFRVLRVDQRGFGRSTAPPPDYPWSPSGFASDLARFLDVMGIEAVHVVGAKIGGALAMTFAAEHPHRTLTLSVLHGIVLGFNIGRREEHHTQRIPAVGVTGWAGQTQGGRLGSEVSEAQARWWTEFMGSANPVVCTGVAGMASQVNVPPLLPRIKAPTLVVAPDRCPTIPLDLVRERQQQIANSELVTLDSDAIHIAAARPDDCAPIVRDFIKRHARS